MKFTLSQIFLGIALALVGCRFIHPSCRPAPPADHAPAVVVVPADRWQYPMTNEAGVAGWFVPLAVHIEMMEAVQLVGYYRSQKGNTK